MICESCRKDIHNCTGIGCGCQHRPRLRVFDINILPQPEIVHVADEPEEVAQ